jgi:phage-related tail fiber protein
MSQYYTLITTNGLAALANAQALGGSVALSQIALGDGLGGAPYNPTGAEVALKNEVWRGAVTNLSVDPANANRIIVETVVLADTGGFTVREAGIYSNAGVLIAIGKFPETYKPTLAEGSGKDLLIRFIMDVSNAASVTIQIDPSIVLATRSYVDSQVLKARSYGRRMAHFSGRR